MHNEIFLRLVSTLAGAWLSTLSFSRQFTDLVSDKDSPATSQNDEKGLQSICVIGHIYQNYNSYVVIG